ncbi:hypothetical protein OIU84_005853 [Salix udensis]|uniref:Uncharacterized protein n=1 Tax=Salix udensis TaxID=889485 RepID=A0AAD6JWZ9_9ROSI|nr:hypothetical protein OIU84_005853 [Salix udensis]
MIILSHFMRVYIIFLAD